jgi:hypothetical protein
MKWVYLAGLLAGAGALIALYRAMERSAPSAPT